MGNKSETAAENKGGVLHGHIKIELTDVNTGKVEKIEKDNMITNALAHAFWNPGFMGADIDKSLYFPVHQKMLGALVLWRDPLEENAENIHGKAGNSVTGAGIYGLANNGTNLVRGSYNTDESSVGSTVIKHVWDFTTNQANGQISAASLAPLCVGYDGYGTPFESTEKPVQNSYATVLKTGWGANIAAYDKNTGLAYGIEILSKSQIAVVTYDTNFLSIPVVTNSAFELREIKRRTINLANAMNSVSIASGYVASDGIFYAVFGRATMSNNQYVTLVAFDFINETETEYKITNTTGVTVNVLRNYETLWATPEFFVYNGYMYVYSSASPHRIFKIEIANSANTVDTGAAMTHSSELYGAYEDGGLLFYFHTNIAFVFDTAQNTVKKATIVPVSMSHILNSKAGYMGTKIKDFYTNLNLVCTIDNLQTPVTKSESQTMKITYTITQI